MQTDNRFFDDIARLITNAAGAAQGVRSEIETMIRLRLEKVVADLDLVPREEFEAVKAMAAKARDAQSRLEARLAALEVRVDSGTPASRDTSAPARAGRTTPARPRKTPEKRKAPRAR